MKRAVLLSTVLSVAVFLAAVECVMAQMPAPDAKGQVSLVTSPGVKNLASGLGAAYMKSFPGMEVNIKETGNAVSEVLSTGSGIALVSEGPVSGIIPSDAFSGVIARDVIVAVINSSNPVIEDLRLKGISSSDASVILVSRANPTWGSVSGNECPAPVIAYSGGDEVSDMRASEFAGVSAEDFRLKVVNGSSELINAIRSDRNGVGFCRLSSVIGGNGNSLAEGLEILPVDRNGNGQIDFQEAIYDDVNSLTRGVWIGKYPKSLVNNIYAVMPVNGDDEAATSFLKWVLADGQKMMASEGHSELLASERMSSIDRIARADAIPVPSIKARPVFGPVLIIALVIIALSVVLYYVSGFLSRRKLEEDEQVLLSPEALVQEKITVPAGIFFDKTHTWAFMDQEGLVTTGVDDFLQHVTGKITRLKMKRPGVKVKRGERFLSVIQNGKQLDLYSPVSGTIVDINSSLETDPAPLNASPYKAGWIYRIEPSNWLREFPLLFMADRQRDFLKKEFSRLRDFLAVSLKSDADSYSQVVLQDGGEIRDGVLSSLGPEVWEEFQSSFIDPSRQVWFYEI